MEVSRWDEWVVYDETSPTCLRWVKANSNVVKVGEKAGCIRKNGRGSICIEKVHYKLHRVIWVLFNGEIPEGYEIDHEDQNPSNNKISNLRLVDGPTNAKNRPKVSNNSSGVTGVTYWTWSKGEYAYSYWVASWVENGKKKDRKFSISKMGYIAAREAAIAYRKSILEKQITEDNYHPNHGRILQ